jgi:hypothetical protein
LTANTPKSRKAKGRALQQQIRADLIDHLGIHDLDIKSTAMGQSGCDLYLSPAARAVFPYGIEAKNQESLNVWSALQQCQDNAEAEGLIPLLIFKRARSPTYAVLRWEDLLQLLSSRGAS